MTALRTQARRRQPRRARGGPDRQPGGLCRLRRRGRDRSTVERRFAVLVGSSLAALLQETQGDAVIIEKVAGFAGRDLDSVAGPAGAAAADDRRRQAECRALAGLRTSPYTPTTASEHRRRPTIRRRSRRCAALYKAALVLNRLGVDIDAQAWLFDVGVRNGLLNPLALPIAPQPVSPGTWAAWTRLVDLAALAGRAARRRAEPGRAAADAGVRPTIRRPAGGGLPRRARRPHRLAARGPRHADRRLRPGVPGRLARRTHRSRQPDRRLRADRTARRLRAVQADSWATADIGAEQAEELRLAAKSKHDEERWPAIARALRDPVREQQRAALVAYLIARTSSTPTRRTCTTTC